jgi:Uma2 family endonuclease
MATDTRASETGARLDRLTVGQYLARIVAGIIPHDARMELLDGKLVEQMTKYAPHNYTARQLGILFHGILPAAWLISEEKSLTLGRYWRPEPDIAIIRGPNNRYRDSDPRAADVALLVEVADSSYTTDRGEKWRSYAAARIPIYWIVNLNQGRIEVYRDPIGRGKKASYREATTFNVDAEVPVIIDGREVGRAAVRDILP